MVTRPSISCGGLLKVPPRILGPLYAHQDMSLVCDAFGFAALCSVCGCSQEASPGQIRFSSRAQTGALRPERSAERIEEVLRLC